ncbi:double-strand break repair protein AddB [Bombella mellum]|uniref:Double-strand break repair protein AddB n=1 Tax=Bombella mellum TaxID=2039288 RepID=A0ABR5ZSV2_9PROT|nr:double-strand break repair protein AddB [Bombella mellum]MBA5727387.1 double-strand break repair protein AddB [Bombella mellum]
MGQARTLRISTIPASCPFLDTVVQNWLDRVGVEADAGGRGGGDSGMILVPGRRVARSLMEAFLRVLDGRPALLPAIVALGDVEQQSLFPMRVDEAVPPAVGPVFRLAILARLILAAPFFTTVSGRDGGTIDRVWPLAQALAELMDDAERNGVDLHEALPKAVADDFAGHWQKTLEFLRIVTEAWPAILREEERSNIMARQVALIEAQARLWADMPPDYPLWAVGFVDGSAGVATALEAVAALPQGMVVFQGLDRDMEDELWDQLPPTHPQALFHEFLSRAGVDRMDVALWGEPLRPERETLFRHVMLPEAGISRWGQPVGDVRPSGISLLPAADSQQEAQAIALILRDVASQPGRSGALVTPDRGLADRVRAELLRFGIHADDSAGEPLVRTPTAVFLRLIAQAVTGRFSPVALLSVLKHPLSALGMSPGRARASARLLERRLLRGPAPQPGLDGLRRALGALQEAQWTDNGAQADAPDSPESLEPFLDRVEGAFRPLLDLGAEARVPELLAALLETAEALAAVADEGNGTDQSRPGSRLWMGEDGGALSRHFVELMSHTGDLPPQPLNVLDGLLTASMAGRTLTGLRGYQGGVELAHPRISIYGVLEARLLAFDTVILGGLNEGIWPPAAESGPWMSRPMRQRVGLPSPERRIGAQAHDFVAAALSSEHVILSSAQRREGAPSVPARWLMRLSAFLEGRQIMLPVHPALGWQVRLDMPDGEAKPVSPPEPRPPLALRPRRLSITQLDTLKLDPYAIYARHVLGLKALSPLEEGAEHADYGRIVHTALERMIREHPGTWPLHASRILHRHFDDALDEALVNPALSSWWRPRLHRIADWVLEQESWRHVGRLPCHSHTEISLNYTLRDLPGGDFHITGRADRIDLWEEPGRDPRGRILDYKTGTPPSSRDVVEGWASQLVLEAALLAEGAFEGLPAAETETLTYWKLSGGETPGDEMVIPSSRAKVTLGELVGPALEQLRTLLMDYDNSSRPYRSQPWAGREARYSDYTQLARVAEWRLAGDDKE